MTTSPTQPSLKDDDGNEILEEIEEIRDAAEEYMEAKSKSDSAKQALKMAKDKMLRLMEEHSLGIYNRGTVMVAVEEGAVKLKVQPRDASAPTNG